ncbi:DivIVA domain-containing protein [Nesterenkonia alba]|uniref:DivIVA domain-containing protein n=1 Tax=Nesterenkonia alba TaxID=515814 RepID=UPI0003B75EDB|nr:DivIVA domain-containing protein [Nesterenkonia alba]
MMWLYLVALAILGLVVVVFIGRWSGAEAPAEESPATAGDDVDQLLARAEGHLTAEDVDAVEFDSAARGYRMDQVDKLLAALSEQLRERK